MSGPGRRAPRPSGHFLVYPHELPHIGATMHWWVRYRQKQRAMRWFGVLPAACRRDAVAEVTILRVLGPRQRPMDDDNLRTATKGLRDALKACGYIVDDGPRWARFTYAEDGRRRGVGPRVEVRIVYRGDGEA
jgi:hypothetical protein